MKRKDNPIGEALLQDPKRKDMWEQARDELLSFAIQLENRKLTIKADQIRLAVEMADSFEDAVKNGIIVLT